MPSKITTKVKMPYVFDWNVPELNTPELKSPRPCKHGAGCNFTGSCGYVHPAEEGTGRQMFPARKFTDPKTGLQRDQLACVRLIGNAGFYRRRQLKMTWPAWCSKQGISYTANVRAPVVPGAPTKKKRVASVAPCSKCGHVEEDDSVVVELFPNASVTGVADSVDSAMAE